MPDYRRQPMIPDPIGVQAHRQFRLQASVQQPICGQGRFVLEWFDAEQEPMGVSTMPDLETARMMFAPVDQLIEVPEGAWFAQLSFESVCIQANCHGWLITALRLAPVEVYDG